MIEFDYNSHNSQMQKLIRDLDVMDDDVNSEIVAALNAGADMIVERQKELAPHPSMAAAIKKGSIHSTRKGRLQISTGYWPGKDGDRHAMAGIVREFGRGGAGQKQEDSRGRKIGKIEPKPHIRTGFDEAGEGAYDATIAALDAALDKFGKK